VDSGKRFGSSKQVKGDLDLKKKTWKSSMLKNLEEEGKEQAEQDELDDQDDQADEESALDLDAMNEKNAAEEEQPLQAKPKPKPTKPNQPVESRDPLEIRAGGALKSREVSRQEVNLKLIETVKGIDYDVLLW